MVALHRLRLLARRFGIDISRFPQGTPGDRRTRLLRHFDVNLVLDVGANEGQFAHELRTFGYRGRIISFEPLTTAATILAQHAKDDDNWEVIRSAVGESSGTITLNVSANSVSSSILPMLPRHVQAAPASRYVDAERVPLARLDDLVAPRVRRTDRLFLKIDAQGYTRQVVRGAEKLMSKIVGLQAELSLTSLYEGEISFEKALDMVADQGFTLMGLEPGFTDPMTGRMLQVDALFFREPDVR